MEKETYWHIRSEYYDRLFWVRDKSYAEAIVEATDFEKTDLVLDIGINSVVPQTILDYKSNFKEIRSSRIMP